jgi:hypothetical protein
MHRFIEFVQCLYSIRSGVNRQNQTPDVLAVLEVELIWALSNRWAAALSGIFTEPSLTLVSSSERESVGYIERIMLKLKNHSTKWRFSRCRFRGSKRDLVGGPPIKRAKHLVAPFLTVERNIFCSSTHFAMWHREQWQFYQTFHAVLHI